MNIFVWRFKSDDDATLSMVHLDTVFECFGLEDEYREHKVSNETRIPAGTYSIGLRSVGGFYNRYTHKFPSFHKGMLQILDVPGFEYILIHIGNTDEDTAGCLLVGAGCNTNGELTVTSSRVAYCSLYPKVLKALEAGHPVTITFIDED